MADAEEADGRAGREISKIQFPYLALDDVIGLARKLLDAGGVPMDRDQLAAALGTAPTGGNFAVKLSALRMFGLLESDAQGRNVLSSRGFEILDPSRERPAKAEAFLSVELFRAVYEQFKGKQLPPRPAGFEQALVALGVSSKQRDRARVMLDRSARLAGFFPTNAEDRLVMPLNLPARVEASASAGNGRLEEGPVPTRASLAVVEAPTSTQLDGVITALIAKLPKSGSAFPSKDRAKWLTMMEMAFEMAYGADDSTP